MTPVALTTPTFGYCRFIQYAGDYRLVSPSRCVITSPVAPGLPCPGLSLPIYLVWCDQGRHSDLKGLITPQSRNALFWESRPGVQKCAVLRGSTNKRGYFVTHRPATGNHAAYGLSELFHFSFGTCLKSNNVQNMNYIACLIHSVCVYAHGPPNVQFSVTFSFELL